MRQQAFQGRLATAVAAASLALAGLAATPAWAAGSDWSLGFSAGPTKALDLSSGAINQALAGQGLAVNTTSLDDTSTGGKLYLGYRLNGNWSLEAGYAELGSYRMQGQVTSDPGTVDAKFSAHEWFLTGVLRWPLLAQWDVHARAGLGWWQAKLGASGEFGGAGVASTKASGTGTVLGLGTQYQLTPQWSARLEWERYLRIGKPAVTGRSDIDLWSLGLVYHF
jgi:OOP family OmpA-OmpF porin